MIKALLDRFSEEFIAPNVPVAPVKNNRYYGCMSDVEIAEMRARNKKAIDAKKADMGTQWVLHPKNKIPRKTKCSTY